MHSMYTSIIMELRSGTHLNRQVLGDSETDSCGAKQRSSRSSPPPRPQQLPRTKKSGWWLTYPSEKYARQLGLLFPICGKIENIPNHQSEMVWHHFIINQLMTYILTLS